MRTKKKLHSTEININIWGNKGCLENSGWEERAKSNQAGLISGFSSMKRLGVFLLPPDGTLVHRSIKFVSTFLYTWVERGTVRIKCLVQVNNTCPRPGLEPRSLDPWGRGAFTPVGAISENRKDSSKLTAQTKNTALAIFLGCLRNP